MTQTSQKQPLFYNSFGVINDVLSICRSGMRVNCVTVDLDIRVCLCELLVVGRWLWVVENYEPFPCRVRGAQDPVVVVLLASARVQEGVSRQLILVAVWGPAETQLLHTQPQMAMTWLLAAILEVLIFWVAVKSWLQLDPSESTWCVSVTFGQGWLFLLRCITYFVWVKKADSSDWVRVRFLLSL